MGGETVFRPGKRRANNDRWGVVQLVGHLTVNEDGEGSNPSAPAKIIWFLRLLTLLAFGYWQARLQPALPPAVHRLDVVVAHFLEIFGH